MTDLRGVHNRLRRCEQMLQAICDNLGINGFGGDADVEDVEGAEGSTDADSVFHVVDGSVDVEV